MILPVDCLQSKYNHPFDGLKQFEGIMLTVASTDPDGEVIFSDKDQARLGIHDYYIDEQWLCHCDEITQDSEVDNDSFLDVLSSW